MHSLGLRLALVISGVLLMLMLTVGVWLDGQLTRAIQQEELRQTRTHASTLMRSLKTLMLNGQGTLAREWLDTLHGVENIIDIEVLRRDGHEAFFDDTTVDSVNGFLGVPRFQRRPIQPHHPEPIRSPGFMRALEGETGMEWDVPRQITMYMPVEADTACLACHGYENNSIRGVLKLSVSTADGEARIAATRRQLWGVFALVVCLLGIAMWMAVRYSVVRPVGRLRDAIIRVGEGDRATKLPVNRRDELGEVASVFNQMQERVFASETRIRAVMDNVVDAIITIDERGMIESANPAVTRVFGYAPSELLGRNVSVLMPRGHAETHDGYITRYLHTDQPNILGTSREVTAQRKDGTVFPADLAISEMRLGDRRYFIGIVRDITERKQQTQALEYIALHDILTDLPNRALLLARVEEAIAAARENGRGVALLLMDLDHFKEINDTLGHHNGDFILQQVAWRLRTALGDMPVVARLGGDEFAVLLYTADARAVADAATQMLQTLEHPFTLNDQAFHVGASIGIAFYPQHGDEPLTLMRRADIAMYDAKRLRQGHAIYDSARDQHNLRNLTLMGELRTAIDHNELVLYYQPKVNMQTGRVQGVEALVRWQHPQHGLMLPDEFIPLAEQTGLIRPLTMWVMQEALRQGREWMQSGLDLDMAVNLSARSLQDDDFLRQVRGLLGEGGSRYARLRMEITETAIMADAERALEILRSLSAMGVRLAIDDFGTGYSSLAYLKRLPVDELKIDKSFVVGMTEEENNVVIVRSTIDLAHNMGLKVVAEGVTDRAIFDMLQKLGCDVAQGYYLAYPMPLREFLAWMEEPSWMQDEHGHG